MTTIYSILCRPDDDKHWTHYVGLFTDPNEAARYVPPTGKSHNTDPCGCVWYYSVWGFAPDEIPPGTSSHVPQSFPYREWG
jgi:hypothetical protein